MGADYKLNRPIHVVDYDPSWPEKFETEKKRIRAALEASVCRGAYQIEHFGSTSVPGLEAKPVIDIAIGIDNLAGALPYLAVLEKLDYTYEPSLESALPMRRFLWKGTPLVHTYHISLEETRGKSWIEHLVFRDYLRANPEEAQRYQALKHELAGRHITDMEAYVQGKTAFVTACLGKAKKK